MAIKQILGGISDEGHAEALKESGYWGKQAGGVLILCTTTRRFLIAQRSAEVEEPLTWGTIGGAVDEAENVVKAVERELREETKYRGALKLVPLLLFKDKAFRYHNFLGLVDEEFTAKVDWETHSFQWFDWGKFPRPLHFGLVTLMRDAASIKTIKEYMV